MDAKFLEMIYFDIIILCMFVVVITGCFHALLHCSLVVVETKKKTKQKLMNKNVYNTLKYYRQNKQRNLERKKNSCHSS